MNEPDAKPQGRKPVLRNWLLLAALVAVAALMYGSIMVKVARHGF